MQGVKTEAFTVPEWKTYPRNFWDICTTDIDGNEVKFADMKGKYKAFLFVNVASVWGSTEVWYKGMSQLQEEFGDRGLKVLAFPCNQFGNEEPGSNEDIKAFAAKKDCKAQLFAKCEVNGKNTSHVYMWLRRNSALKESPLVIGMLDWNFEKFLVDGEATTSVHFREKASPAELKVEIEKMLA